MSIKELENSMEDLRKIRIGLQTWQKYYEKVCDPYCKSAGAQAMLTNLQGDLCAQRGMLEEQARRQGGG